MPGSGSQPADEPAVSQPADEPAAMRRYERQPSDGTSRASQVTQRPPCSTSAGSSLSSASSTRTPAPTGVSRYPVTISVRLWLNEFHTTTEPSTTEDSNPSALSR